MMNKKTINKLIPWFFWGLSILIMIEHIQYDHKLLLQNDCNIIVDDDIEAMEQQLEGMAFQSLDDLINFESSK